MKSSGDEDLAEVGAVGAGPGYWLGKEKAGGRKKTERNKES